MVEWVLFVKLTLWSVLKQVSSCTHRYLITCAVVGVTVWFLSLGNAVFQVNGIGPIFKLSINVQNRSESESVINMFISFNYDSSLYNVRRKYIPVSSCRIVNHSVTVEKWIRSVAINNTYQDYVPCRLLNGTKNWQRQMFSYGRF